MRASESHLVRFHGARVHALLGGPDELLRDPWFGRDAIRTAATWAGIADAARAAALEALAPRALAGDDLAALAVGRIDTHAQTIDLWLAEAGRRADAHPEASHAHALGAPARGGRARRARRSSTRRCGPPARARWRAAAPWTAPPATCASSCSSTGSTRCSCAPDARRSTGDARSASTSRPATPRPRPVGLRDERLRARRSTSARWRRSATVATRAPSRRAARSASSPRCSPNAATSCSPSTSPQARGRRRARAPGRAATTSASSAARCRSEWPAGPFDLVVCSEILYYWDRPTLEAALAAIAESLAPGGRLVAVHYRPPSSDRSADRRRRPRPPARAPGPRTRRVRGQRPVPHRRLRRMRPDQRIVIVGGGPAALSTARSYREAGGEAPSSSSAPSRTCPTSARR